MRTCKTCTKKFLSGGGCKVLTEMIGKKQDCWAWTDDPNWEQKIKKAVQEYALKRMKKNENY